MAKDITNIQESFLVFLKRPGSFIKDLRSRKYLGFVAAIIFMNSLLYSYYLQKVGDQSFSTTVYQDNLPYFIIITGFLGWLLISAVFHLFMKIFKGKGSLGDSLLINGVSGIPTILGTIFFILYHSITEKTLLNSSGIQGLLVSYFNPFAVWSTILLIIGYSALYKLSIKKTLVPIAGIYIIGIISYLYNVRI